MKSLFPPLAFLLTTAVVSVRAESLAEYCAKKGMVPDGVEGRGEWGCKERDDGGSGGGVDDSAWRRARAQAEAEAAERQRKENEARRRKREQEKLEFEQRKEEALGDLKGMDITPNDGLKGFDDDDAASKGGQKKSGAATGSGTSGNLGLKSIPEDAPRKPKECRIVDSCMKALSEQERALDEARLDQKDLYWALGSAEFKHGLAEFDSDLRKGPADPAMPKLYVYESKDKSPMTLEYSLDQYRASVDRIRSNTHKKLLAYGEKAADAAADHGLDKVREQMQKRMAKELLDQAEEDRKISEIALEYSRYIRRVMGCGKRRPEDFKFCWDAVNAAYEKAVGHVAGRIGLPAGMMGRVEAFSEAYRGYSDKALRKAQAAALTASKCVEGCKVH